MAQLLIIDDDPVILEFLVITLTEAGHQVTTAADGWEGMKRFRPYIHELVITDVCMPLVDGSEIVRVLRREVPSIPIIAITGHASFGKGDEKASTLDLMNELGATRVLTKPLSPETVLAEVDACLAAPRATQ